MISRDEPGSLGFEQPLLWNYIIYIISLYTSESQQVALCTAPKLLHHSFCPELSQAVQRLFWASEEFQVPSCQSFQIFEQKQCLFYFPDGYPTSLRPLSLSLPLSLQIVNRHHVHIPPSHHVSIYVCTSCASAQVIRAFEHRFAWCQKSAAA